MGLVGASGVAAFLAPEAAPAEILGAEERAALIQAGSAVSKLGAGLTGYARGGMLGAAKGAGIAIGMDSLAGHIATAKALTGGLTGGVTSSSKDALSALLGNIGDALRDEEEVCGVK